MESNFDLNAWGKEEAPEKYTYKIVGIDKSSLGIINAIKAQRNDGKTTVFTQKRFSELQANGKLTVTGTLTFDLKLDKEFDPNARFQAVDLS